VAGRNRPNEKSSDLMGNRKRDRPACNIVPQPTTLLNIRIFRINNYAMAHKNAT
jgi:hypothetical protein